MSQKNYPSNFNELETTLDLYLVKKAPALPPHFKEALVRYAPWVIVVLMVLSLPAILALLGLSAALMPVGVAVGVHYGIGYFLSTLLLIVSLVLELMALPGLFAKQRRGWVLLYYSALVSALSSLVSLNIVGFIIGTLISLYLIFQVRSYYK